jgi:cysteine desulfurase/selenocysteine lyase
MAFFIALKVALDFITETKKNIIRNHESDLLKYATEQMRAIEGLRIIGTAKNKVSLISFVIKNIHPQDMGVLLDNQGIAVRTGHHCTEPLMKRFGIPGTVRASFAMYNTKEEVDKLVKAIKKAIKMLS